MRCPYNVPAAAKSGVKPGKEIIQVCRDNTHSLMERCLRSSGYESQEKHSPRQPYDVEFYDEEVDFLALIVLGIRIRQRENQSYFISKTFQANERADIPDVNIMPPSAPPAVNFRQY